MRAMSDRESSLQLKLIPVNIIVCIICLAAAVSMLIAPLVTFSASNLVTVARSGGDYSIADDSFYRLVSDSGVNVTFGAIDLMKISSSDKASDELVRVTLADSGVIEKIGADAAFRNIVQTLGFKGGDVEYSRYDAIVRAFRPIGSATSLSEVDKVIEELIPVYEENFGAATNVAGLSRWASNVFELAANRVTKPRTVDWEAVNSVIICEEYAFEEYLVSFIDVAHEMLGGGAEGTLDAFLTSKNDLIKISFTAIWAVVLLSALSWVVLFAFSLVHLLLANRMFTMWYVKLFGALPCLLFGVLPLLLPSLGLRLTGILGVFAKAVSGATSMAFISGGCYVLLWLVSIFWAFPIKHRIRQEQFR